MALDRAVELSLPPDPEQAYLQGDEKDQCPPHTIGTEPTPDGARYSPDQSRQLLIYLGQGKELARQPVGAGHSQQDHGQAGQNQGEDGPPGVLHRVQAVDNEVEGGHAQHNAIDLGQAERPIHRGIQGHRQHEQDEEDGQCQRRPKGKPARRPPTEEAQEAQGQPPCHRHLVGEDEQGIENRQERQVPCGEDSRHSARPAHDNGRLSCTFCHPAVPSGNISVGSRSLGGGKSCPYTDRG